MPARMVGGSMDGHFLLMQLLTGQAISKF
ncbi:hypothetical protein BLAT2472_60150 [Burkholderia latens]